MTFPFDVKEMEVGSFRDAADGSNRLTKKAVQVENSASSAIPVTTLGVVWDSLQVEFPSETQDKWKYYKNGNQVLEILVTYESNAKKQIVSILREVL